MPWMRHPPQKKTKRPKRKKEITQINLPNSRELMMIFPCSGGRNWDSVLGNSPKTTWFSVAMLDLNLGPWIWEISPVLVIGPKPIYISETVESESAEGPYSLYF